MQERDHQSFDVLSAGGEGAQVTDQTNPLVNQHESLDAVFNCLEDMVSILLYLMRTKFSVFVLTLDFDSCH